MSYTTIVADSNLLETLLSSDLQTNEDRLQAIAEFRFNQVCSFVDAYQKEKNLRLEKENELGKLRAEIAGVKNILDGIVKTKTSK
jgi:hypothetical protein